MREAFASTKCDRSRTPRVYESIRILAVSADGDHGITSRSTDGPYTMNVDGVIGSPTFDVTAVEIAQGVPARAGMRADVPVPPDAGPDAAPLVTGIDVTLDHALREIPFSATNLAGAPKLPGARACDSRP